MRPDHEQAGALSTRGGGTRGGLAFLRSRLLPYGALVALLAGCHHAGPKSNPLPIVSVLDGPDACDSAPSMKTPTPGVPSSRAYMWPASGPGRRPQSEFQRHGAAAREVAMKIKAIVGIAYAGRFWAPGSVFDARDIDALAMIGRDEAQPAMESFISRIPIASPVAESSTWPFTHSFKQR